MGQDSRERREARAGGDRLRGRSLDQRPGLPHPSSAGSPGLGRAPGGRQCHCWGPRPHVPSCRGGFRKARSGLARGVDTQIPRGVWAGPARPGAGGVARDARGGAQPEGLTWLHSAADDPQDVGGVPQLPAVVDTHVHLAWGAPGATRGLALPTPASNPMQGKLRPRTRKGHHQVSGPQVSREAARTSAPSFPPPPTTPSKS